MKGNNLHLIRPELMFSDSFRVSGPLKGSVKNSLVCIGIGMLAGIVLATVAAGILASR
jgi:hypothetical protein